MFINIQSTTNSRKVAKKLAQSLIQQKLAKCVKISPCVSFFTWQNKDKKEKEFKLDIIALKENFTHIEAFLAKTHNYKVFELVAFELSHINATYEKWLKEDNAKEAENSKISKPKNKKSPKNKE